MKDLFFCCPKCKSFNTNNKCLKCEGVKTFKEAQNELLAELGSWREARAIESNWNACKRQAKGAKKGGVLMFYFCPKCKEQSKYSYWEAYKGYVASDNDSGGANTGYLAKCFKCGYDESSNKQLQTSDKQRQKKDEGIIREMVATCLPPPKTPTIHFGAGSGWKAETGNSPNATCWAEASSFHNAIRFTTKLWNQPRTGITDTTAHECGHLAPERGMTLEDAKNEGYVIPTEATYKEADEIEKNAIQSGYSLAQEHIKKSLGLEGYGHKVLPYHLFEKINSGWMDNKIPNNWEREGWRHFGIRDDYWGAGGGHGDGWFGSYHNYKSMLESKFSTWIRDPDQPPARMYQAGTYSEEWFNLFGHKDRDQMIKAKPTHAEIDRFGDKFFKADEDWNNYVANLPDASNR